MPSWVGAVSTSQRAVMHCGWGVKTGMVRMWVAGKTEIPRLHTGGTERFRDKGLTIKRCINSSVFTALHGMQTRSSDENSVCLSVCPSVRHTRGL